MNQAELSGFIVPIVQAYLTGTGVLSGVFYPRYSNPSGYLVSGAFISQTDLDSAITQALVYVANTYYPNSNPSGYVTGASGASGQIQIRGANGAFSGDSSLTWNTGILSTKQLYLTYSGVGGTFTGKIFPQYGGGSFALNQNVGTNMNLTLQPHISLGDGIAFASVNDANTANLSMEFRASQYQFWSNPVTIDGTLTVNSPTYIYPDNSNTDVFTVAYQSAPYNFMRIYSPSADFGYGGGTVIYELPDSNHYLEMTAGSPWQWYSSDAILLDSNSTISLNGNMGAGHGVGIGTMTPAAQLHIETSNPDGAIANDGNSRLLLNVDFNNNPTIELHRGAAGYNQASAMYWDWAWDDNTDYNARIIMSDRNIMSWEGNVQYRFQSDTSSNTNSNQASVGARNLAVSANSSYLNQSLTTGWAIIEGNLGVGTKTPSYKIDVSGGNMRLMGNLYVTGTIFQSGNAVVLANQTGAFVTTGQTGSFITGTQTTGSVSFAQQYVSLQKVATTGINWNTSNVQYLALVTGVQTLTFSNPISGGRYILMLKQPASGTGASVNWPTGVLWGGGTAPTLTTTTGKVDLVSFIYDGVNAKYYGNASLNF